MRDEFFLIIPSIRDEFNYFYPSMRDFCMYIRMRHLFGGLCDSPFCRRTAFFCLEDSVKMSATRESTFGRNDVVAIIWIFQHHIFGSVKTSLAEPYSEVGVQALIEKLAQFVL